MTAALRGTWFVVRTSLPLWRRRTDPSITYGPLPDGRVRDTVRYRSRGRWRTIEGIDRWLDDAPGAIEWRGTGALTRWTTSRWSILSYDEPWMVIHFSRTPFTPAGVDILWREPAPDAADVAAVEALLAGLPEATPFAKRLFAPRHSA